ncbi:hypothetical protein [Candidatus Halobonum tyrrellensis]|uniref:Right handed beta helix domain-containing protein n=1 Tax=Candidatus Halobonum tyrrellensis G22 TaxID=1324957 RepID=V4H897_9EURY|nr:hypothetical protein [Candidatus Halobonum tyrrellensis]ESP86905.1 hypothetical protein K933_16627 [Candidatus Halobonum tyrrellensis G22]
MNVVDDLGLDPNGNEPIQGKLNNAEQDGTLFVFPEGDYLVTDRILMLFNDAVGMVGQGNVRFTTPSGYNDWAVIIDHGEYGLFENIDVDLRANNATPGCRIAGYTDVQIRDVEFIGQGIQNRAADVNPALGLIARDSDAEVLAENVVARNKGRMGEYNRGNGRVGAWVGQSSKGTVTIRNCHVSGFPNNGLYTSRTPGAVQVEGGVFRNNDISQVRLGSEGSYVKNALIEVDPSKSNSPNPWGMLNGRGVRIESGQIDSAGVTVENCDIRIADGASSQGGVVAARPGGMFDVVDTRIQVDAKYASGVLGRVPDGGSHNPPPKPHRARLRNVSVTGDADGGAAVDIRSRPDSMVRSCCIQQSGNRRTGVKLVDSNGSAVRESTVNVSGQTVETESTNANVWGNSTGGSCPAPGEGGASTTDAGGSDDDGGDDSSSDASNEGKRLTVRGKSHNSFKYVVEVSGEIHGTDKAESGEGGSGGSVTGWVGKGEDSFTFTGEIERLVVKGKMTLRYRRSDGSPNVMKFGGNHTGEIAWYNGRVSGDAGRTWKLEDGDSISSDGSETLLDGCVAGGGWWDSYHTHGEFRSALLDGDCAVSVDD